MKQVQCNKCGHKFETARNDLSRIRCSECRSNESLSIRQRTSWPETKAA